MACTGERETRTYTPTNIDDLTDDLLEHILLRVSSPVGIVRAAATCRPWRWVIGGASFLRRFRSRLHVPQLLGYFVPMESRKVPDFEFVPAATAPGLPSIDITEDIDDLEFLRNIKDCRIWELSDSRGGLLAFVNIISSGILVCDPMTGEKMEAVLPPCTRGQGCSRCFGAFLLDPEADDTGTSPHISRFRVLCLRLVKDFDNERFLAVSYLFSARDKQWLMLSSTDASNVYMARLLAELTNLHADMVGRVAGSIFWSAGDDGNVLVLDESTGEFSVFTLPPPADAYSRYYLRVIAGDARTFRLARIVDKDLEELTWVRGGGACMVDGKDNLTRLLDPWDIDDWNLAESEWTFCDTASESEVGLGRVVVSVDVCDCSFMSYLDVKTMCMEELVDINSFDLHMCVFPYEVPWSPTICACLL